MKNHLRKLRRTLEQRKFATWQMLRSHLPSEVSVNYSEGGYFLWVELPQRLDAMVLYRRALKENISLAPGKMFTVSEQFNHCFRLNASFECARAEESAIKRLAELIQAMLDE